ncbi:hypothetical protein [Roseateles sp.]|uniref:hypothetical protein n=1 Tax=Roseateles sp. TaxID=1971397 RepID=UPI0025ED1883|nr:hypothetical protein [Roseateles sp.]MBV8037144.1 hypothetical protein [Roseateles sp.]
MRRADGDDLAFVTARVVDAQGRAVPRAPQALRFSLEGEGDIVATDNGDATSFQCVSSSRRKAFGGQALVVVRDRGSEMKLRAEADGPQAGELLLRARP